MRRARAWLRRRASLLIVVAVVAGTGAGNLELTSAQAAHQIAVYKAGQRHQGEVFEQKLCTTLGKLARRKPPGGSPRGNPSRGYLQWQHGVLAELGPDVGCKSANQRRP